MCAKAKLHNKTTLRGEEGTGGGRDGEPARPCGGDSWYRDSPGGGGDRRPGTAAG